MENLKKPIKILRIVSRLNIGGPAIHTILLSAGLNKDEFETLLVTGIPEENEGNMSYLVKEKGVSLVAIPELGRNLNICNDVIAFWKLFHLIRKERPDIVHTHTAKAGTLGRLATVFCKLLTVNYRPKLVHTFHGHVLHSYFGRIKSMFFICVERFLAAVTDRIIAVSINVRKELISLGAVSAAKTVIVALGLELDRYLRINSNGLKTRHYKTVGIIGRLVPIKNHKMFLDAAKKLKSSLGDSQKVKFVIVGDGFLRQELESYAEQLGIKEDVIFTGWVKDLSKIYSDLDIVTLSSLNEGTPVALIEAQAAARPCVATKVGGAADVIEDGKSGFLISTGDVSSFAEALAKLLTNPDLALAMGKYGREKVKDRFNKTRLFREIESLYREVVSCKKRPL